VGTAAYTALCPLSATSCPYGDAIINTPRCLRECWDVGEEERLLTARARAMRCHIYRRV